MRFSICNEMFGDLSFDETCAWVAAAGYDGIEIAPYTLADDLNRFSRPRQRGMLRQAEDRGLDIVGFHWLLVKPEGLHILARDNSTRESTKDIFRRLIEIAVNMKAPVLTLGSPDQRSHDPDETLPDATQRMVAFLRDIVPDLESAGVGLALEPLELHYTNMITSTRETCAIAAAVGSHAVGVTLDTHFLRWECERNGTSARDAFDLVGSRLMHLHIQDDNFLAPGSGSADFAGFANAVKGINWRGAVSIETLGLADAHRAEGEAQTGIACLRRMFSG